ncbi:MAG: ComEA family DNA-binding protein [Armatimonadetes bacterium]|nr:ComEA family DNA-binding protein [Armatimonadota bacterium]
MSHKSMVDIIPLERDNQEREPPAPTPRRHWSAIALAVVLVLSVGALLGTLFPRDGSEIEVPDGDTIAVYVVGEVHRPGVVTLPRGSRVVHALQKAGGLTAGADPMTINMAERLEDEQMLVVKPRGAAVALDATEAEQPSAAGEPETLPEPPPVPDEPAADDGALTPAPEGEHFEGGVVVEEVPEGEVVEEAGPAPSGRKVSINRATVDELQSVPGIGPQLAQAIVTFRQGPPARAFSTLEDLMEVPGIKEKKLEQLRPYIDL